jgi:hypothetical protein
MIPESREWREGKGKLEPAVVATEARIGSEARAVSGGQGEPRKHYATLRRVHCYKDLTLCLRGPSLCRLLLLATSRHVF